MANLGLFVGFGSVFAARIGRAITERFSAAVAGRVIVAAALALVVADFLSGLVHFLCDNFGSPTTPILGQKFIKAFREHHDDPAAMTHGDFVEVNADNLFVCLPVLLPGVVWLDVSGHLYFAVFLVMLMAFIAVTNEVHKWAHSAPIPPVMRGLQATRLFLHPRHHQVHHDAPHDSNYCITSGVLNPLLTRVRFWYALQRVLSGGCRRERPQLHAQEQVGRVGTPERIRSREGVAG